MDVALRTLTADDLEPAFRVLERTFGGAPHPDDVPVELSVVDPARFYGGVDGDEIVATGGSFAFEMAVPGNRLPVAGVTWVGVSPTHRRRGVLTALMSRQLSDLHDAGTAVTALWASEGAIYGRFGYGVASWHAAVVVPSRAATGPVPPGVLRLVEPSAELLRSTYDAVAARTPGFPARDDAWWAFRLHFPEHRRDGGSPLQCVLTDGGYALYSTQGRFAEGQPAGVVQVLEVVAADREAHARLWRYLLDLDLMTEVRHWTVPVDDPLLHGLLLEPRAAKPRIRDGLHVRLVDVCAALSGRRYAAPVDVVLDVTDAQCPWNAGRVRLTGGRDGAACTPTTDEPELAVDVADLGAAYLGGTPLRARPVAELAPGALARTSTAFGPLDAAPWCPQVF